MTADDDGNTGADFIAGIYNYCDRWCAHCAFTARCRLYQEAPPADEGHRPAAVPPSDLHVALTAAVDALRTLAASHELTDDRTDDTARAVRDRDRSAWDHPLSFAARDYAARAGAWLDARAGRLEEAPPDVLCAAQTLSRYRAYIAVKLQRAFRALADESSSEDAGHAAAGSAKVALLAMDRSIEAWSRLLSAYPDDEDALFPLLVHLERLRRAVEEAFPDARLFLRPGFDRED